MTLQISDYAVALLELDNKRQEISHQLRDSVVELHRLQAKMADLIDRREAIDLTMKLIMEDMRDERP